MSRKSLRALPSSLLAACLAVSPAGAQLLQARGGDGDLLMQSSRQGSFLRRADGSRVDVPLAATASLTSLAAVHGGERIYAAAVDGTGRDRHLLLLGGSAERLEALAVPEVREPAELREPALLVDETGLRALAWLEGPAPRRQALRLARRAEDGWQKPETVSPPGAGSQMALATAYAGNRVWILAWAAYDGHDDEILWSRFSLAEGASAPRRLAEDNEVPDIVPYLVPTAGGILAAWNRYDGSGYRLEMARYDGKTWTTPVAVAPRGSLYPTLHTTELGTLLLYQQAWPRGWVVAELDRSGNVTRTASVATENAERPAVLAAATGEVSLLWPGQDEKTDEVTKLRWSGPTR